MYAPSGGVSAVMIATKSAISVQPATVKTAPVAAGRPAGRRTGRGTRSARPGRRRSYAIEPLEDEEEDRERHQREQQRRDVLEAVEDRGEGHGSRIAALPSSPRGACGVGRQDFVKTAARAVRQNSRCDPISTARSRGSTKYSTGSAPRRAVATKRRLRHRLLPGASEGSSSIFERK